MTLTRVKTWQELKENFIKYIQKLGIKKMLLKGTILLWKINYLQIFLLPHFLEVTF